MPQSQQYRRSLIWTTIATVVMALAMTTLLVFEFQQRSGIGQKDGLRSDSITALTFHFEREFLRLQRVLDTTIHSGAKADDLEALSLHHDLLLSRIDLLRHSANLEVLVAMPVYASLVPKVETLMDAMGKAIDRNPIRTRELQTLLQAMDDLVQDVHALSLAANSAISRELERQEKEALDQNSFIITLTLTMMAMLLAGGVSIAVRQKRQEADRQIQKHLLESLRLLNEQLESRVEERTRDLWAEAARKALALSLVEATLNATDNGILVVGSDEVITSYNKRFAELWHLPTDFPEQSQHVEFMEFADVQVQNATQFHKKVDDLRNRPANVSRDTLELSDGRVFSRVSRPQHLEGLVVGRVWSFLDISDQVQSQRRVLQLSDAITEELNRSKHQSSQLQAVLRAIPDAVWMKDTHGTYLMCNPAFEHSMGRSANAILGSTDREFFSVERASAFEAEDQLAMGQASQYIENWVDFGQGRGNVLYETVKAAVRDDQQRLIGMLGVSRDVTKVRAMHKELEQAKEAAQHSSEAKSLFLANMSHEIRTPMNAIIGMAELALHTELNARQRNYVAKIKSASDSLLHIINDILDFSKIEAGKLQMESVPFDLEDVFDQLSSLTALRAERQGIELAYEIDMAIPTLLVGDALRLGQILSNLVSNALKFSAGGNVVVSVVQLSLDPLLVELQFSIRDEGIGLSPEQLDKLFQPFTQADASTTRKYGGTGLGLAICRHLIALLGGRIWADSSLGVGSTFHFTAVFQHDTDRRLNVSREFANSIAAQAQLPVLVVDDNPIARALLVHVLQWFKLRCIAVDSGAAAIALVEDSATPAFLACLIDWYMPEPNGLETMRQLRATYRARGLAAPPMVLVTAHIYDDDLRGIHEEFDGLIAKPVSARKIGTELARVFGADVEALARSGWRQTDSLNWRSYQGLDILLVEDVEINREVMLELLASVGMHARIAVNGQEALEQVAQRCPDLILMDCQMPVMDGYTATRRLRVDHAFASLPIIALTAGAMVEDKRRCFAAGMNGYVSKPVRLNALYEQLLLCVPAAEGVPSQVPPHTFAEAPKSDMPVLPGIDVALGLAHVGGRLPVLFKVLKKFRDNQCQHFEMQIAEALEAHEWSKASRLVHSLKGVARTLGAAELGDQAVEVEQAIEVRDIARVVQALMPIAASLQVIRKGLAVIDMAAPDGAGASLYKPLDGDAS